MEEISAIQNDPNLAKYGLNKRAIVYLLFVLLFLILLNFFFLGAPANFPVDIVVNVKPGMSIRSVSFELKEANIIRSRAIFETFVILFNKEKGAISNNYYFADSAPVYEVAWRLAKGEHQMAPVSVTIPEGFDTKEIGDAFAGKLSNFDKDKFLSDAEGLEGYLFPDTYFFLTTDDEEKVISSMSKNFERKISPLLPDIISSGKTEKEIITMASIIEREAEGEEDREIISGILWKRMSIGMALQVDAAPETYKEKGLPENPICNPGILAIKAAIFPEKSPYLYYLHDKNGNIYYAKTFAEHIQNKAKYLK